MTPGPSEHGQVLLSGKLVLWNSDLRRFSEMLKQPGHQSRLDDQTRKLREKIYL